MHTSFSVKSQVSIPYHNKETQASLNLYSGNNGVGSLNEIPNRNRQLDRSEARSTKHRAQITKSLTSFKKSFFKQQRLLPTSTSPSSPHFDLSETANAKESGEEL